MTVPAITKIVNPWLFGDAGQSGSPDSEPTPTLVASVPVSAFLEIQSPKYGLGFLNSRLTTAQINAMTVVNGMQAYNSTLNTLQVYQAGAWANLLSSDVNLQFPAILPTTQSSFLISTGGVITYNTQPLLSVSGTLSAAQMTALNTTSVSVLGVPGVGLMYEVDSIFLEVLTTGHTPFATGGTVALQYGTGAGNTNYATELVAAAFFANATNFTIKAAGKINTTTGLASTVTSNVALNIAASADFTNGAGSSVNYIVRYRVIPVA